MKKIDLVCIIDDDPIFVFGTRKILQLANFGENIIVFNNGAEALNNLKTMILKGEKLPDVILLDINMPIMDGWQFLESFSTIPTQSKIHIYIISSSLNQEDIRRAKSHKSVDDYIVKPVGVNEYKRIAEELLV
ncbi:MAG: response regulator [Aequorivita antarctica]